MKNGLNRFEFYLGRLEKLLDGASAAVDPALYLYANDARGILFRLEALGRVYSRLHNANRFSRLTARFKILEDVLGDIDHYDTYRKCTLNGGENAHDYFTARMNEAVAALNQVLRNDGWLNGKRLKKTRKKLMELDWLPHEVELKKVKKYYKESIAEIRSFYQDCDNPFTDIENEVHELRRDLRWLSIYPHAFLGMFSITGKSDDLQPAEYIMDSSVFDSPFLIFPLPALEPSIMINFNGFVELSWIIERLGRIKDIGLEIFAMKEAREGEIITEYILNESEPGSGRIKELLQDASELCRQYFDVGNPEKLLENMVS